MPTRDLRADDARRGMPAVVGVGLLRDVDAGQFTLHPDEAGVLGSSAVERRRRSFALGRAAAREALAQLGAAAVAIGQGPGGEPLWPRGVVGAITHTGDLAIAIAGWQRDYAGLGVDLEQLSPGISPRAARRICTPAEFNWIESVDQRRYGTMLFSAKEAVFKALYPIERVWLGFGDAELRWRAERCAFEARLLKPAGAGYPVGTLLEVHCTTTDAHVLCTTYALAERSS
jgi:enterobactin synthetase component D